MENQEARRGLGALFGLTLGPTVKARPLNITTKKIEITDGILPTDIFLSVNLNYRRILPMDSQILITDGKIHR